MTRLVRRDPELLLPESPVFHRVSLPLDSLPVRRYGPAGSVTGPISRDAAVACGASGIDRFYVHDMRILSNLRTRSPSGAVTIPLDATATAMSVQRSLDVDGARVTETLVLIDDVLLVEWTAADPIELGISFDCDLYARAAGLPQPDLRWNANASVLCVERESPDITACIALSAPFSAVEVGADSHVRLRAALQQSQQSAACVLRLAVAVCESGPAVRDVFASLPDCAARIRAAAGAQRRRAMMNLRIASPSSALDESLEWEKHVLADWPRHGDSIVTALAALAFGHYELARTLISNLPPSHPALLLLAARYSAWSGDSALAASDLLRRAQQDALKHIPDQDPAPEIALRTDGMLAIANVARDLGAAALAAELESRAKRVRIEHAVAINSTSWAHAIADPPALALRRFESGDATATMSLLDVTGLASFPGGVAAVLVFGMLGAEADASRGRLRLRPQLPADWPMFDLIDLRVGEAAFALRARQRAGEIEYEVEQTEGPVPFTLILEPALEARSLRGAEVDGRPAHLDTKPHGSRLLASVQLVLDAPRRLKLTLAEKEEPPGR